MAGPANTGALDEANGTGNGEFEYDVLDHDRPQDDLRGLLCENLAAARGNVRICGLTG